MGRTPYVRHARKQYRPTKVYIAQTDLRCSGCRSPIPEGEPFVRDAARSPWHKDCRRRGVIPQRETPRYLTGDPIGKVCPGCDLLIYPSDEVVHRNAQSWHGDCKPP